MNFAIGGRRRHVVAAFILLLLSVFLQFSVVLSTQVNNPFRLDAGKYVSYAYNLKHFHVFSHAETWKGSGVAEMAAPAPDKLTLPGYPAFLSLFLDGRPDAQFIHRVTLAQALLGVVSTLLAYLIALRILPLPWAFAAGALVATSPHMATISTYMLTEALYVALLLASILAIVLAFRPQARRWQWAVAGLLLGVTCLVRPQMQVLPLLVVGATIGVSSLRAYLPRALILFLCFAAVLGPWLVRNANVDRTDGEPDLLVTTLYHGSFPNMMYRDDPDTYGFPYENDPDKARITRDLPSVLEHIRASFAAEPWRYAKWYLLGKPGTFLSWGVIGGAGDVFIYPPDHSPYLERSLVSKLRSLHFVLHWPLMLLGILAAFMACWRPHVLAADRDRQRIAAILAAIFLYVIVMHMIGAPFSRYAIPFRPLAYVLALTMAHALWVRTRTGASMQLGAV